MKKFIVLPFALFFCFLTGCKNNDAINELDRFREKAEAEEINKSLAMKYVEAINNKDFDFIKDLLSPDYAIYSPSGYADPTSREKLIEGYMELRKSFQLFEWTIEDIIAANDKVTCRIIIKGTYKGEIPNLPSVEQEFKFSMITILRFEDGRVVEEWQEDDQLGFARQLGMELKPKEPVN